MNKNDRPNVQISFLNLELTFIELVYMLEVVKNV